MISSPAAADRGTAASSAGLPPPCGSRPGRATAAILAERVHRVQPIHSAAAHAAAAVRNSRPTMPRKAPAGRPAQPAAERPPRRQAGVERGVEADQRPQEPGRLLGVGGQYGLPAPGVFHGATTRRTGRPFLRRRRPSPGFGFRGRLRRFNVRLGRRSGSRCGAPVGPGPDGRRRSRSGPAARRRSTASRSGADGRQLEVSGTQSPARLRLRAVLCAPAARRRRGFRSASSASGVW